MASAASRSAPGPALEHLGQRMKRLHRESGEPSFRVISPRTGKAISHTTPGSVLRCESPPGWGPLELVVEALGGDVDEFRTLWTAVRDETSPLALPTPVAWEEEPEEPARTKDLSIPDLDAEPRAVRDERLVLLEKLNGLHARRAELYFTWAREEESQRRVVATGREADKCEQDLEVQDLRERLSAAESLLTSVMASKSRDEQDEAEDDDTEENTPRMDWRRWRRSRRAR
ncbi:hypothetical protein [Streptomyces sp. NPDC050560]|uniref:hypothetical protein n=1 Tax=Streptomyces sp. NPDC050560 TaxID=3365630 RepID=UPI0037AEA59D